MASGSNHNAANHKKKVSRHETATAHARTAATPTGGSAPAGVEPLSPAQHGAGKAGSQRARLHSLPDPEAISEHPNPAPAGETPAEVPQPQAQEGAAGGEPAASQPKHAVQAGYRAPVDNPYLTAAEPLSKVTEGPKPAWDKEAERRRKKGATRKALLILLAVVVVIAGVWAYAWANRSVTFTLDGNETTIKVGSTIADVVEQKGLTPTAGNLVSVNGDVLQEGQGNPYSVKEGDTDLTMDQANALTIEGGENITIGDGTDITEPYTTETKTIEPKLLMEGSWGAVAYVSQWGKEGTEEFKTGTISGQTDAGTVTQEVQDCVITLTNPTPSDGQKLVALTFDDGPSAYTQKYLDILSQYGAKATFFCLGCNVSEYPDQAKAIVDAGCQIASHTQNHKELTELTPEDLQSELTSTFTAIKDATGVSTTVIRPPYGEFRERTWLNSGGKLSASILWTQDSEDWKLPGVDTIVSNALLNVTNGSIILMHDGGGNRDQDLEALPKIIEALQADGYQLVTIDELLASDSSIPSDISTGDATLPEGCVWPTEIGDL